MKVVAALVAFAVLSACTSPPEGPRESTEARKPPEVSKDLATQLQNEFGKIWTRLELLEKRVDELHKKEPQVDRRLDGIGVSIEELKTDTTAIRRTLAEFMGRVASPTIPTQPKEDPSEKAKVLKLVEELTSREANQATADRVSGELRQHAERAIPVLIGEVTKWYMDLATCKRISDVLAAMPPQHLAGPLEKGLKERKILIHLIETIRKSEDRQLGKLLEPYLNNSDDDQKVLIAHAMACCKNRAAVPVLIEGLRSGALETRTLSFQALRQAAGGQSFGYEYLKPADTPAQVESVKKWDAWWQENKERLFD